MLRVPISIYTILPILSFALLVTLYWIYHHYKRDATENHLKKILPLILLELLILPAIVIAVVQLKMQQFPTLLYSFEFFALTILTTIVLYFFSKPISYILPITFAKLTRQTVSAKSVIISMLCLTVPLNIIAVILLDRLLHL